MRNLVQDTEDNYFYFTYHHSAGDSMSMMNPDELDDNVFMVASFYYIVADLD